MSSVFPDFDRFIGNLSVLSTVIRAQYLFRRHRETYRLRILAKRNRQKRATERDWQEKLRARMAAGDIEKTPDGKFLTTELEARARKLEEEREGRRAAQAIIDQRAANPVIANVHADLNAVFEAKRATAKAEQLAKCHAEFLSKLSSRSATQSAKDKEEAAAAIQARAANPLNAALSKEVKVAGEAASLRAETRDVIRRRGSSVLVANLNDSIKRPDNLQRLKSIVATQQSDADEEMARKLKRGSRRATYKPIEDGPIEEVRIEL